MMQQWADYLDNLKIGSNTRTAERMVAGSSRVKVQEARAKRSGAAPAVN
jgi:hypothetical protein